MSLSEVERKELDQQLVNVTQNIIRTSALENLLVSKGLVTQEEIQASFDASAQKFLSYLQQAAQAQSTPEAKDNNE